MSTNFVLGRSIKEPPIFYGKNYDVWKNMIKACFKSIDFDLWYIDLKGPHKILITRKGKTREKLKKS